MAAKITWPAAGTCDAARTNYRAKKGVSQIEPGNYCGGMRFASGAKVTLKPGTYVVQSGSVSFGANAQVDGPGGVTLVLLDPTGSIDMQGGPRREPAGAEVRPLEGRRAGDQAATHQGRLHDEWWRLPDPGRGGLPAHPTS
jgi:hypothetical protein